MALVSRSLGIPPALLRPGIVVVTTADADPTALSTLRETVEVIATGHGEIDWPAVLVEFSNRGWQRVLCEGGPSLHGELVRLDLVDELCLTIAPVLAGGDAPRIAHGHEGVHHAMTLGHAIEGDGGLLTRWVRTRA